MVRRLHDTNRSGWYSLISFVPLVGPILLLVWTVLDSMPFENRYGAPPEAVGGAPAGPGFSPA